MLQAIKGYYDNGVVILDEQPKLKQREPIVITFLNENIELDKTRKVRKIGGFEGSIKVPNDFNEPLDDLKEYMY